ncbi:MAG TPA: methyltransferase domain-containing protein [Myxococcota bacterium]|nr:methyltransferase domain-containing protein [Myxococcota bacterium]
MGEPDPYFLGYRRAEQERLERQAGELAGESEALFARIGVGAGWRVLEIGCGPQGCLGLLSQRVGASGRVTGIERSAEQADTARRFVAAHGLANVELLCADGRATGLLPASFDLVTARLVLVNVPEPEEILAEMVRLTKPGGVIALHEPVASAQRIDPPHHAQDRLLEILDAVSVRERTDRNIGLRLPRMLRSAGVRDVEVIPLVHVYPPAHGRRYLLLDFVENARGRILEYGLLAEPELRELTSELRGHLDDPGTLVVSGLFFQAFGKRA